MDIYSFLFVLWIVYLISHNPSKNFYVVPMFNVLCLQTLHHKSIANKRLPVPANAWHSRYQHAVSVVDIPRSTEIQATR